LSKRMYFASAIALLFVLAVSVSANPGEHWNYLGSAHFDGAVDHDNIHVGRSDGQFRAIQLRVSDGAIEFLRVIAHFSNGTREELAFRDRIPSGGASPTIDLPGERRIIESVELWYSKDRWERRPRVTLYGSR
jgi:hypothetical protein